LKNQISSPLIRDGNQGNTTSSLQGERFASQNVGLHFKSNRDVSQSMKSHYSPIYVVKLNT